MSHKQLVAKRNAWIYKMYKMDLDVKFIAESYELSVRRTIRIIRKMRKSAK